VHQDVAVGPVVATVALARRMGPRQTVALAAQIVVGKIVVLTAGVPLRGLWSILR
jgi:hypothetical protein